jgi:Taurine catabolism dioxygenase TauD, TfdA family
MITHDTIDPVALPTPWRGEELQLRPDVWLRTLQADQIAELVDTAARIEQAGLALTEIKSADWPLPSLQLATEGWRQDLHRGAGMVLVRGLPVRTMGKKQAAIAYWLIGLHLGDPVPQNAQQETLVDIRDTGASATDHNTRLYKTRADLSFHTDGADIIGLLCLRVGKSGGVSRICSSVEVYNQILNRKPELAPLLTQPYHHHAHGQFGEHGPKTFQYPIVTRDGETFRMLLLLWYIRNAAADFPDIVGLSDDQNALLDMLESIPFEPGVALDMAFREGDMQFLKNSVVLHARTEYEDWDDADEKRHLLRLWLSAPDFADGDDQLRRGFDKTAAT